MNRFGFLDLLDHSIFYQRLLSEDAVKQMTSRQTAPGINESYGLCFAVGPDWCGHGGGFGTSLRFDRKRGLALIWMVQDPENGSPGKDAFTQAAQAAFAH